MDDDKKDKWVQIRVDKRTHIRIAEDARSQGKTVSAMFLDYWRADLRRRGIAFGDEA